MNKVIAVVAHPDDEIIGVGGTLAKHVKNGDAVAVLILGDGKTSRKDTYAKPSSELKASVHAETEEALKIIGVTTFWHADLPDNRFDSLDLLDVVKLVSKYIGEWQPRIVYTHHHGDLNIDHRIAFEATITAVRPIEAPCVREVYLFETLSSTEMAGPLPQRFFIPNTFVDITEELDTKLLAMSKYVSEVREFPHPRSIDTIKMNARVWGSKNNIQAAEAFFCFRKIS